MLGYNSAHAGAVPFQSYSLAYGQYRSDRLIWTVPIPCSSDFIIFEYLFESCFKVEASEVNTQFRRCFVYNLTLTGTTPSSPLPFLKIGYTYHGAVHAIQKLTQGALKQRLMKSASGKRLKSGADAQ